jgi:hypothetical protein
MALLEEQFTETLQAGAPDITYQGNQGKEQKIARELWDNLPPEAQQKFGNFQQFFSSGAWKQVLQMLQQQMQQQAPQQMAQQPQQGLGSMMPAQMADGGMLMASASNPMDEKDQIAHRLFGKGLHELTPDELIDLDEWLEDKAQKWGGAYGGIAGADGRRQYGIGSWFQKKIMDPIKKNIVPIGLGAGALYGLNTLGKGTDKGGILGGLGRIFEGGKKVLDTTIGTGDDAKSLGSYLMNPNFLIPAAGLVAGTFAKKDDPGYTGQGTGLNLRDVGRIANITDPKTAMASGLRFSPDLETRKFTPAEMLESYAATDAENFSTPAAAQGGRIGYALGAGVGSLPRDQMKEIEGQTAGPDWFTRRVEALMYEGYSYEEASEIAYTEGHGGAYDYAQGGRIGAQEGGLMSLGGMEMDLRGGGFVPLGAKEKADDVPARLSKNEFVFTADAVRAAGGGDVDAGADKMYNTMKQLESRVG